MTAAGGTQTVRDIICMRHSECLFQALPESMEDGTVKAWRGVCKRSEGLDGELWSAKDGTFNLGKFDYIS